MTASLKQKQKLIKKTESLQQAMIAKQEEISQQVISLQPVLKLVIQKTKELQGEVSLNVHLHYISLQKSFKVTILHIL